MSKYLISTPSKKILLTLWIGEKKVLSHQLKTKVNVDLVGLFQPLELLKAQCSSIQENFILSQSNNLLIVQRTE